MLICLAYSIGEEMSKERGEEDPTLEEAIDTILKDRVNTRIIFLKYRLLIFVVVV